MTKKPSTAPETVLVSFVDVDALQPYDRNARVHSSAQVDQIVASIEQFGWTNPILVDVSAGGVIVAGHGRQMAARAIYKDGGRIKLPDGTTIPAGMVPVIDCSGWSEAQRRAYTIADNKIAENATWDESLLKLEIGNLLDDGLLDKTAFVGFSVVDLNRLLADPAGTAQSPEDEWEGMPEFDQRDKTAFRTLPVHFKDQEAVDAFARLVGQKITEKTRFLWYPEIEIERYADKRYTNEAAISGLHSD